MFSPLVDPQNSFLTFGLGRTPLPINNQFKAKNSFQDITKIIGSSVKCDARQSVLDTGNPPLFYFWSFVSIPIGSEVARVGFESIEDDDSIVSFTPDITGFYRVSLVVSDGIFDSNPVYSDIYIKILDVPTGQGLVPDASFIWDYLGDFWNLFADQKIFSTMWSSYVQIFTNRLLSLYQTDFNKSILTIQDYFQKKWLNFNPELSLEEEESYFILGDDYCGVQAFGNVIGLSEGQLFGNQVTIPLTEANLLKTPYGKKVGKRILRFWDSSYNLYRSDVIISGLLPSGYSLFFTKNADVISTTTSHPWRLCYTLGSFTKNFEKEGVKIGDRVKFAVQLSLDGKSTGQTSYLYLPIIAVRENQIGFSLSDELQNGVSDPGLSNEVVAQIAKDLQIDGITEDLLGNILYLPNTLGRFLKDTITSVSFKKSFYEEQLLIQAIDLGYFQSKKVSLLVRPISIFRYKAFPLPDDVISIPTLQEYIEQPGFSETPDGKKYIIKNVNQQEIIQIYRNPLFLFENLDFITSATELDVSCSFIANSKTIFSTFGDFVDRSIEQGDIIQVPGLNGGPSGESKDYVIVSVRAGELDIQPSPSFSINNVRCKIMRRISGNYLRFVNGAFNSTGTPAQGLPPNLWSEVTFFDNGKTIEDNFGILVSITREQLKNQKVTSSYRAAVAGLLYGLSKGPSMKDLRIGAQILLGLPFTYYKGIILDIKPNYEVGPNFEPKTGRITIEETDVQGKPTGLITNYFYPQGAQILIAGKWVPLNPDFSGLAINPVTEKEYQVGDSVEQFAPLSKGILIVDYLSDPAYVNQISPSFIDQLRKYHTIYLRANTDLFNGPDFSFVVNYIKLVKSAFLFLKSAIEKDLSDQVIITDKLQLEVGTQFFDISGLSLPGANTFSYSNDSQEIFTMDGRIFTRYIKGYDLSTLSTAANSQAGGFITARANEMHDSPYILAGDTLIIYSGPNMGSYTVSSVLNDQNLITSGNFEQASNQTFAIYREIKNPIWNGTCSCTQGNSSITLPNGDLSSGIAVGDKIFFYVGPLRTRTYRIISIAGTAITLDQNFIESSITYSFVIYREALLTNQLLGGNFSVSFTNGNPWAVNTSFISQFIPKKGDTLTSIDGDVFDIFDFDETINGLYLNPTPSFTTTKSCQVTRSYAPTGFPADMSTVCLKDVLELELLPQASTATINSGSAIITFSGGTNLSTWNVLPGDFFKLYTGGDASVDIGYGMGVFVIAEATSSQLTLTRPLQYTQNTATYSIKRIKDR